MRHFLAGVVGLEPSALVASMTADSHPASGRKREWLAVGCTCDFSGGTRGMDRCGRCDGTGSRLLHLPSGFHYPNTKEGWNRLVKEHGEQVDD